MFCCIAIAAGGPIYVSSFAASNPGMENKLRYHTPMVSKGVGVGALAYLVILFAFKQHLSHHAAVWTLTGMAPTTRCLSQQRWQVTIERESRQ